MTPFCQQIAKQKKKGTYKEKEIKDEKLDVFGDDNNSQNFF